MTGAEMTAFVPHRPQRPEKSEGGRRFKLVSGYEPAGDQPQAIEELVAGLGAGGASDERDQVLLGVTGSGKTFTMAKVIQRVQRPALILAPNKTLAAQLYSEMKNYFPENAVEYFVSYYDYYQPEAYIARTDTYIEKDSSVNEQIDRMRHSATRAILERDDVIIVASVSCIYGIGAVETYSGMAFGLSRGERIPRAELLARLVALQFRRNDEGFARGCFRARGDTIDIFPAHYEDRAWRVTLFGDEVDSIFEFDPLTGRNAAELETVKIYANSHYVTPRPTLAQAVKGMREELRQRLDWFRREGKLLEAQRLEQRTMFDLEMIEATGSCAGIENYSRWLTGRRAGEPPPTLFEYLPDEAVVFVDEFHVTVPQLGGMYRGDFRRKATLAEYGFRLPSCIDNRPLKFEEWELMRPQTIFVSATPGPWELARTGGVFTEQVIRPTGLIDPPVEVRPVEYQVDDLLAECKRVAKDGYRALVTTLTKRMAEDLTEYLHENGVRVRYMHSDVETLERIEIIRDLRLGAFDVLVGINLLREGSGYSGMRARRHPRRRQGRLPAFGDLAGPDHRTRGAQCRRARHSVCGSYHRLDGAGDGGNRTPPREAAGIQPRERHHAPEHQEEHHRHHGVGLRARPRSGGVRIRRRPGADRAQSAHPYRRAREAHARSRGQSRIRGGRAAARRDQAAAGDRARDRRRSLRAPIRGGGHCGFGDAEHLVLRPARLRKAPAARRASPARAPYGARRRRGAPR